jgi:hypothetical protein
MNLDSQEQADPDPEKGKNEDILLEPECPLSGFKKTYCI